MAAFRLSSETIGEGIRVILFVLAITALLFGLWPAIGGSVGVFAMAAESTTVEKEAGITTAEWTTQDAPSLSWIHVHVESNFEVDVRIVAANHRSLVVHNVSGFASQEDLSVVAGGGSTGPNDGIGTNIDLGGSRGGPVRYIISVRASDQARLDGHTDRDIAYTLTWEVQKLDPTVFLSGLVLFAMFFVTEYMLHIRADLRTLARRVDRMATEGPGAGRAPSAALGEPSAPPYGFREGERAPPDREERESAIPGGTRAQERGAGRRRLWGRSSAGQEVPPATEEEAVDEGPAPSVSDPYAPPRTAASSPPVAEEVPEPEYYAPPPPAPPAPAVRPAKPPAPPPAPPRRAAAPPPPARPAAPAPPRQAAAPPAAEAVTRVRCPQCKHIVPVYTAQRPTPIKCPNCGKKGMLTR